MKCIVDASRLEKPILWALPIVDTIFQLQTGEEATITSTYDGKHKVGSFHPLNLAVDLKNKHIEPIMQKIIVAMVKRALGDDFEFLISTNCFHLEWDPDFIRRLK